MVQWVALHNLSSRVMSALCCNSRIHQTHKARWSIFAPSLHTNCRRSTRDLADAWPSQCNPCHQLYTNIAKTSGPDIRHRAQTLKFPAVSLFYGLLILLCRQKLLGICRVAHFDFDEPGSKGIAIDLRVDQPILKSDMYQHGQFTLFYVNAPAKPL